MINNVADLIAATIEVVTKKKNEARNQTNFRLAGDIIAHKKGPRNTLFVYRYLLIFDNAGHR